MALCSANVNDTTESEMRMPDKHARHILARLFTGLILLISNESIVVSEPLVVAGLVGDHEMLIW